MTRDITPPPQTPFASGTVEAMSLSMTDDNAIIRIDTGGESPSDTEGSRNPPDSNEPLSELVSTFERYFVLPHGAAVALALWVLHTHMYRDFYYTPRLIIRSAVMRSGKTSVLMVVGKLAIRAVMTADATPAVVFRLIASKDLTLILDEADTKDFAEYRSIINAGYRKDGCVLRCDPNSLEPREFPVFGPIVIGGNGRLPQTIEDRGVIITMKRKLKSEKVERIREDRLGHLVALNQKCACWVTKHRKAIAEIDPPVPEALNDRAADNWRPLLAIAEAVGGEWPQRARNAALALDCDSGGDGLDVLLLSDIRQAFATQEVDVLISTELLEYLNGRDDRPWSEINKGTNMTAPQLAHRLKPFEIAPKQLWTKGRDAKGKKNERGYEISQFKDAFARYLDDLPARPLEPKVAAENGGFSHQQAPEVSRQFARDSAEKAGSSTLAGNPGEAPSGEVEEASDGAA